jgi:hypothetical protein
VVSDLFTIEYSPRGTEPDFAGEHLFESAFPPDQNKIQANVECIEKLHNLF